jgi:hypothetical protein
MCMSLQPLLQWYVYIHTSTVILAKNLMPTLNDIQVQQVACKCPVANRSKKFMYTRPNFHTNNNWECETNIALHMNALEIAWWPSIVWVEPLAHLINLHS